jgi:hypothetical protein
MAVVGGLCFGCAAHKTVNTSAESSEVLELDKAQKIVDRARGDAENAQGKPVAPASLSEVMDILRRDESERFASARDYLTAIDGVDALSARATLEMLWADGYLTVAVLANEQVKRKLAERDTLREQLKLQAGRGDLTDRLHAVEREAEYQRRLAEALTTLAEAHNTAGTNLAEEIVRRNPERADGYSLLANLSRLREDWSDFQTNIAKAEARSAERVDVVYARAMERAARVGDRTGARQALDALVAERPDLARLRAQLVLLQDDIGSRYAELEKLKTLNPRHALVLLEGPAIESEYQVASELRRSRAGR